MSTTEHFNHGDKVVVHPTKNTYYCSEIAGVLIEGEKITYSVSYNKPVGNGYARRFTSLFPADKVLPDHSLSIEEMCKRYGIPFPG